MWLSGYVPNQVTAKKKIDIVGEHAWLMGVMTRFKASAEVCVCLVKVSLGFLSVSTTEYLESGIGEVFLGALLS